MRVAFLGSPAFALPSLERLIESEHEVVGVFTQPDRPVGRGRALAPPPVKELALARGLPVFQPESISKPEAVAKLREIAPDVGVIAAYGQILRQAVLEVPPLGILNVHASLLPRWRGAAPITAAILRGDAETGATIMRVVRALDAGPMLASGSIAIAPDDTTGTLTSKVAEIGAELLLEVLPKWAAGEIQAVDQNDALTTYAPMIKKQDALIDWARDDAAMIARQVRAYNPWPMAYSSIDGLALRIVEAVGVAHTSTAPPGTVLALGDVAEAPSGAGFAVTAREGALAVVRLQPPGRAAMPASAYVNGHREIIGRRFETRS